MKAQGSVLVAIVLLLAIAGIYGYYYYYQSPLQLNTSIATSPSVILSTANGSNPSTQQSSIVTLNAPAVDNQGNGVLTVLRVEAKPGTGRTLVDINNILFFVDTQNSIQTARAVAANLTHENLDNIDLIYSVATNATVIEGPSAGAALTISTVAALEGKQLTPNVMITGTINDDGTIGQVGGVSAKAKAAKSSGATLFLVPQGQGSETTYAPIQNCQQIGVITYCTTEYKASTINVSKDLGVSVKEVNTIKDALPYFGLS